MTTNQNKFCYLNGKIVSLDKAYISPMDIGFLRGYAVFDVMAVYDKKPFLFKEHFNRLQKYAKFLGLNLLIGEKEFGEIVKKLVIKNNLKDASVRSVISGGKSSDAGTPGKTSTLFIFAEKMHTLPDEFYKDGIKLTTLDYCRQFSETKSSNYVAAIRDLKRKNNAKAFETLYVSNGKVLECSTSNFFIVKNNILITSKNNVLHGETRNLTIRLAKRAGYKIEEREVLEEEILSTDEAFLTATNKKIVPVVKIDKTRIANGKVGENTKKLIKIYNDYVASCL